MITSSNRIKATLAGIRDDDALHFENYQVLSLVQALWGAITPGMAGISLKVVGEAVHVYFYLESDSQADRALVEEVVDDIVALQFTDVPVEGHVVLIGNDPLPAALEGRCVFRRHAA